MAKGVAEEGQEEPLQGGLGMGVALGEEGAPSGGGDGKGASDFVVEPGAGGKGQRIDGGVGGAGAQVFVGKKSPENVVDEERAFEADGGGHSC